MKPTEPFSGTFLVSPATGLIEALRCLDEAESKVLFVVGADRRLIGAVTDGDIRRHLLSGKSLEDTVELLYNRDPKSINSKGFTLKRARATLKRQGVSLLPVTSEAGEIVDIVSAEHLDSQKGRARLRKSPVVDVPVVIMAGGKGTRLDPFTRILPKPLVPLGQKPIIEIIMDRFSRHGVDEFFVTVSHRSKMIKAYFEEFKTKYQITYVDEKKPLGTAGGLRFLPSSLTGPLFVSNSDILIEESYAKILQFHRASQNRMTIVASVGTYSIPYGVCEIGDEGQLASIREKPNVSYLANTGMYVIEAEELSSIPKDKFFHITDLIGVMKGQGKRLGVFPISEGAWLDIGDWEKYQSALDRFKA